MSLSAFLYNFTTYEYIPRQCKLTVPEFHRNGIIYYVLMGFWILSVDFMFIKFIHGLCHWCVHLFLLLCYVLWMNHSEFIHPAVDGIWVRFLLRDLGTGILLGAPSARVPEQCAWASRGTAVLKVRSGGTPGFPRSPRGVLSVKTIFIKMLRCYLPFTFILSWVYTGDPEVMWHAVLPCSDGWWNVCCEYCWTLKMAQFSFLTLRSVDGYNPYKQWLLGALIFKSVKESWKENFENCLLI